MLLLFFSSIFFSICFAAPPLFTRLSRPHFKFSSFHAHFTSTPLLLHICSPDNLRYSRSRAPVGYFQLFFCHLLVLLSVVPLVLPGSSSPSSSPLSSAHVDMSTGSFDAETLDLDAEEPPESQGDPHSPKGTSGSVISPQANAHRLPFFKKVTGARDIFLLLFLLLPQL